MKKTILILAILFASITAYSQDYTGLSGYLTVKDNVMMLMWQNNNYKILTDWASLALTTKTEAEVFGKDIDSCMAISETLTIQREKYKMVATKADMMIYNSENQYMLFTKKYAKKSVAEIKEAITYMKY